MRMLKPATLRTLLLLAFLHTGVAHIHAQPSIRWEPYPYEYDGNKISAELGRMSVPETHGQAGSRNIELAFVRLKSTSATPGPPIIYLAGGPGGSGISLMKGPRGSAFLAMREAGDVIALDQRGVGVSRPNLGCSETLDLPLNVAITREQYRTQFEQKVKSCADHFRKLGVDLDSYNIDQNAHDIEALRQALGANKINLWASSFGTQLAFAVIRSHGDHIGKAVLSGVEGPDHTLKLPRIYAEQMARLGMGKELEEVLASIGKQPITASVFGTGRVTLSRFDVEQAVIGMLGTRSGWEALPELLAALKLRSEFAAPVQGLAQEIASFRRASIGSMMTYATDCSSGASKRRLAEASKEAGAFRNLDFPVPDVCPAVGVKELPAGTRALGRSTVPVLFISGTLDSRTPAANAEEMRKLFPASRHMLIHGAGHGHDLFISSPEIPKLMTQFMTTGQAPAGDVTLAPLAPRMTAFQHVTVINPRKGTVEKDQTVIVTDGRISTISGATFKLPAGTRVVDGTNKFLIPGLWDSHVHLTKAGRGSLPLFVANGITGVRDMGSDVADVVRWKSEARAGSLIAPTIVSSGQILEARSNVDRMKAERTVEPVDRIRIGVSNVDEAKAAVNKLADLAVDHIKMRTSPSPEAYRAVAEEAKRRGLPFASHPIGTPEEVIRSGVTSVEHFLAFPPLGGKGEEMRTALIRETASRGVWVSNTMANLDGLIATPYEAGKRRMDDLNGTVDPLRPYVCGYLVEDWREQVEESKGAAYDDLKRELPGLMDDFKRMHATGVRTLAGSDVGVMFVYPGFSMHDQLSKMVRDIGMSSMDVLKITTNGPAQFYGREREFGAIEPGLAADLVLLSADPLADIANTRRIEGVMLRGRWLDRAALDGLLERVRQDCKSAAK